MSIAAPALTVYFELGDDTRTPMAARFFAEFSTREEADALLARLPKSAKVALAPHTDVPGNNWIVNVWIVLRSNGVNSGRNETGVRRIQTIVRALGEDVYQNDGADNAYPTLAEALAAIG